jgi:hypothetical protein
VVNGLDPQTLANAYAEIEAALAEVSGLRVGKWGDLPQPPGAFLGLPSSIERMTNGSVLFNDLELTVVVGRATARNSLLEIMRLTGAVSQTLDPRRWQTFSDLTIVRIEYGTVTIAGGPDAYLSAFFHIDLAGA